ncbi:MAG: DUF3800 domain-containing protein [Bryobacteraceae bacterium]
MALLSAAYFDASGTNAGSVMAMAGLVAPVYKWLRFEGHWESVLREHGVDGPFHMTDFVASERSFVGWKGQSERRKRLIEDLVDVVKRNVNKVFVSIMENDSWRSVEQKFHLRAVHACPYSFLGFVTVVQIEKWRKAKRSRGPVDYIFEDGDDGKGHLDEICRGTLKVDPVFKSKATAIPCQAADLIAWKARRAALDVAGLQDIDGILRSLRTVMVTPGASRIFTEIDLIELCQHLKIRPRRPNPSARTTNTTLGHYP